MKRSKATSTTIPPAQLRNLERWHSEWSLFEQARESEGPPTARVPAVVSVTFSGLPVEPIWPQAAPVESETPPVVGHIRLLHPDVVPHVSVPVYYAVLSDWEDDLLLACCFSPFLSPATRGELLTGRKEYPLRVLCPWSAVTVLPVLLAQSWHVDCLSAGELADAWKVFRHAATGEPLPAALWDRVGPPIVHPLDSRITYQRMLAAVMAPLARQTARWFESVVIVEDVVMACRTAEMRFRLPMAAKKAGAACCQLLIEKPSAAGAKPDLTPAGYVQLMIDTGRLQVKGATKVPKSILPKAGDLVRLVSTEDGRIIGHGVLARNPTTGTLLVDLAGEWKSANKTKVLPTAVLMVVKE